MPDVPGDPVFSGIFASDGQAISGDFTQSGQTFPFDLTRLEAAVTVERAAELQQSLDDIRAFVDSVRVSWQVPGVGLAIVKDGEIILSKGFGYRHLTDSLPVTSKTLFAIGSSTKAFTTLAMGILVDKGLLDWDEPVREYLPDFELHDEYASRRMTPRDLVTHRSGLPRHDLMWYNSPYSRREIYDRLRYLEPNEELRVTFQYQNLMFMTAGYLIGRLSSGTWEDFVRQRIFSPLGMTGSNLSVLESQQAPDYALPYEKDDEDIIKEIPFREISAVGPAGSINSCADDMAQWLLLQLGDGKIGDTEIIAAANLAQMHVPYMVFSQGITEPERIPRGYGLGWFAEVYRGHNMVHHGGNIDGFSALVSLLPEDDIGVVVLANLNATPLPGIVRLYVSDLLLGLEPIDWHGKAKLRVEQAKAAQDKEKEETIDRVSSTKPSHKLEEYTGEYEHAGYGVIKIELDGKNLKGTFNDIEMPLEHWHYDIFRGVASDIPGDPKMLINFYSNTRGDVDRLRVPLEVLLEPIEFVRRPSSHLSDSAYLAQFVGDFELAGQAIKFYVKGGNTLVASVAGQPPYDLEPYKENEFTFKDLSGFSIEFVVDDKKGVTEAIFKQPNGVFIAKKSE
ncbi:MAG: serine hydrolase [candidate division Zixibacteria bacterium]|nr:serine hydrolase [candidate division Zixibacteria bacterium]